MVRKESRTWQGAVAALVAVVPLWGGELLGETFAAVNPYHRMQEREEVFELTEKPRVTKEGDKWVITFASKAKCDATVAIVGPDAKIVRHLASGVLGKNAPWPFQQGSLRQKIEWDGLADDFKKAPPGCKVRVCLGLKAALDKSIAYDPYFLPDDKRRGRLLVGRDADGKTYVVSEVQNSVVGRVFDREGRYVRTFLPVPAGQVERAAAALGAKLASTKWGDKVLVCGWFGPYSQLKGSWKTGLAKALPQLAPGVEFEPRPRPSEIPASTVPGAGAIVGLKFVHLAADRARDEVYAGFGGQCRFLGKTGRLDETWFARNGLSGGSPACEACVGVDGLAYLRFGQHCYGRHMIRLDHEGKPVPFKKAHTVRVAGGDGWWTRLPKAFEGGVDAVYCGVRGHSNTFTHGLYVSPGGRLIVGGIQEVDAKWAVAHGIVKEAKGPEIKGTYVVVWDNDGRLLTADAVGNTRHGHGLTVDRDGNIYAVIAGVMPAGQTTLEGSDIRADYRKQGGYGSLVKFRGRGGKYPLGHVSEGKQAPPEAVKLIMARIGPPREPGFATGALWAYGGIVGQSAGDCRCHHIRHDMDFFARSWIPANQCFSVMVLDANGNRVARFGRYGNVDDSQTDLREKRGDGIRLAWPRAVAVSDAALYVADAGNRRILRAALTYQAEQTVALPGR